MLATLSRWFLAFLSVVNGNRPDMFPRFHMPTTIFRWPVGMLS